MRHPRRYLLPLTACLVLLQAADFCLTWVLLASGLRNDVVEANPLALSILDRFGWAGLAGFKSACSLVALAAILAVSRRRVNAATRLLAALCLVMAGVVGYSGALLASPPPTHEPNLARLERQSRDISLSIQALTQLDRERSAICRKLLDGRTELPQAMEEMRDCLTRYAPRVTRAGRADFPEREQSAQVASYVYYHATRLPRLTARQADRLPEVAAEVGRHYPSATLIDARLLAHGVKPTWRTRPATAEGSDTAG